MNTCPRCCCHFSFTSSSGTGRCGSAGAPGTLSRTLSRHRADRSSALAHSGAAANITSAPPLLAVLGAVYVLYKWSLELLMWSVAYLSSSRGAMEFQLLLTPIKIKSLSNKGFFKKHFNCISLIYDRLLKLSTSC